MEFQIIKKVLSGCAVLAVLSATVGVQPAAAAVTSASHGPGSVVRARLYEDGGFGGGVLTIFGTSNCGTESPAVRETVLTRMSIYTGWNDVVSTARDYAQCDIDLWADRTDLSGWVGSHTGYIHYNTTGGSVPVGWNDRASALALS